jgi:hypothetical protein
MFRFAKPDSPVFCRCAVRQFFSAEPSSAKSDGLVFETEGSKISRTSDESSETVTVGPNDWRTPLVRYLENPGDIADRKVQRQASKYVMLDNTLYR